MIISSLFFGTEGTYNILGSQVQFEKGSVDFISLDTNFLGKLASNLLKNRIFNILTLSYMHVFVHEMGHALAYRIITGNSSLIQVYTSQVTGKTQEQGLESLSNIQDSIVLLAGPLSDVAFSIAQIFTAFALRKSITSPIALALATGGFVWIFGEAYYATNKDGDFARIARNGFIHLLSATATMVGVIALGVFAIKRANTF